MSMLKEVRDIIERNKGDIGDTINVLNQMILIYSILKTESNAYDSLLNGLLKLKLEFQMRLLEYYK